MKRNKNRMIGFMLGVSLLAGCAGQGTVMTASDKESRETEISVENPDSGQEQSDDIYVYVCGHVENPGVYQLTQDSRICDALALAGGVSEDGRAEALNQAEHMEDGQTLYVPGIDEGTTVSEKDGLLDINAAGKEEFMTLPGIGEAKAIAILAYREEHGAFGSIEEMMDIPGIKEGVFNKIKNYIKVS